MDSTRARERQGEQGRARAGAGSGRGANLPQQWRCGGRVGGAPERAERCGRWTSWEATTPLPAALLCVCLCKLRGPRAPGLTAR
jgi:hypothetical protein